MDVTRLDSQRLKDVTIDNPVHTLTRSEEDVLGRYAMRGGSSLRSMYGVMGVAS